MYQALYRKYRPTNFNEIEGQNIIVKTLQNAIINNKISHAYLFTGPRGTGKTSIAKIFAKTVNCDDPKDGIPCNKCVSCTQINDKKSTDIIEIDAASNNGIDEIRELKSKVSLVPNISKYKVYIIDEVHMLTTGAFNALLKTLEEPPNHAIFILATTEPQKIPSTILSRCQRYDFKKLSIESIVNRLDYICRKENINIDKESLSEIARISDGGMRDSISILDQVSSYKVDTITLEDIHEVNGTLTQGELKEFIVNLLNANIEETFNLIDKYDNRGKNLQRLIEEIIIFLRNIVLYVEAPNYLVKNKIDIEIYEELESLYNVNKIYDLINIFNGLSNKIKTSSNPKIVFEMEILRSLNISREIKISNITKENKISNNKINESNIVIPTYNIPEEVMKKLKQIRVDNILSMLDKKIVQKILKEMETLDKNLLNDNYGKLISLLLDGNIKAGSKEGLIYVYDYINDSLEFNNNILNLEKIFKEIINEEFKLISVSIEEWEEIKEDYNKKRRNFEYKKDNIDISQYEQKSDNKDMMINMFDNIIEYTKEEL